MTHERATRGSNAGHAIISGGSSGIGLAVAKRLAGDGLDVTILARNEERLLAAQADIVRSSDRGANVNTISVDVGDAEDCAGAVRQAVAELGPPSWAVACAGSVTPGTFLSLPVNVHEEQLRSNYLGTVYFAKAVVPHMTERGGGRLVFVSSGAAFCGLYGYAAYGASKFAVRGLAESSRVELARRGISVSIAYPPDTDTPQLAEELPKRSAVTSRIAGSGGRWQADEIAHRLVDGARKGRFELTAGWRLALLQRFHSVIAPALRAYQGRLADRFGGPDD